MIEAKFNKAKRKETLFFRPVLIEKLKGTNEASLFD